MASRNIDVERIAKLINSGELHSRVIRDVAVIEMRLDTVITYYFTTFARWMPFNQLILDRISVSNKVSIVDRIPYERRYPSLRHIKTLRDIIHARNFLAHTHYLHDHPTSTGKLHWLYLFDDYPRVYDAHWKAVSKMFHGLFLSNDIAYHNPNFKRRKSRKTAKRRAAEKAT